MAVMVIIGLMSAAVVLAMPKDKPVMQSYADILVRDINLVAQSGLLTGRTTALGLSEDSYALYSFENNEWIVRREGEWPDGVFVTFEKETAKLKLTEDIIPLVIFEPTGESTVFSLTLRNHDQRLRLKSSGDGRVLLEDAS